MSKKRCQNRCPSCGEKNDINWTEGCEKNGIAEEIGQCKKCNCNFTEFYDSSGGLFQMEYIKTIKN